MDPDYEAFGQKDFFLDYTVRLWRRWKNNIYYGWRKPCNQTFLLKLKREVLSQWLKTTSFILVEW